MSGAVAIIVHRVSLPVTPAIGIGYGHSADGQSVVFTSDRESMRQLAASLAERGRVRIDVPAPTLLDTGRWAD